MHPLFARPARLLVYFAAWLVSGALLAEALATVSSRPYFEALVFAAPLTMFYGAVCLAAWWVCRSQPIDAARPLPAIVAQGVAALLSAVVWVAIAAAWSAFLTREFSIGPPRAAMPRVTIVLFLVGALLYLLSAVVHYLLLALESWHAETQRALQSQVTAREAELRALRAQLNPHFLFNSLNSINALVGGDPERARRMCQGLGDFLRRTLTLGAREAVSVGEELALVDCYLEIEQVRFGDRLRVERHVDPAALSCRVPPLLLQPLIENAIKHGVADRIEGGTLRLGVERRDGQLIMTLENPVDGDAPPRAGAGLGLDNVRRRLAVLGARDASLIVTRSPDRFNVTMSLLALDDAQHPEAERG